MIFFKNYNNSQNFAIVYLRMALDRVDTKKHVTLLPNLLDGLQKYIDERKIFDQWVLFYYLKWLPTVWDCLESNSNPILEHTKL